MTKLAAALILATAIAIANIKPVYAIIPVQDHLAESSLVTQITHQLEMITYLEQQVQALSNMVSLSVVASTMLGDSLSPELSQLFSSMQSAYVNSNAAYGSLMAIPGKIDQELTLFEPPPGGWESMTVMQAIDRAQRIRKMMSGTNSSIIKNQADALERRQQIAAEAAKANGLADRSVSALSATQAVAQQMRVAGHVLSEIEQSNSDIASGIAAQNKKTEADEDIVAGFMQRASDKWHQMTMQTVGRPTHSMLYWGNH